MPVEKTVTKRTETLKIIAKPKHKWLLIYIWCCLLSSHYTYCTTISIKDKFLSATRFTASKCPHLSVAELVKNSPVILRALGTHIYTNKNTNLNANANTDTDTDNDNDNYSETESPPAPLTYNSVKIPNTKTIKNLLQTATTVSLQSESVLLTLVPETIYRGASLLEFQSQRYDDDDNNDEDNEDNDSAKENFFKESER